MVLPTVLIIDDDDAIASHAPHFLAPDRWSVEVVRDIEHATTSLRERAYDFVLLDVALTGLPITAGMDLVETARGLQPNATVIVISAFGSDDVVAEALQRGANRFLDKPMSFGDLEAELLFHTLPRSEHGHTQTVRYVPRR